MIDRGPRRRLAHRGRRFAVPVAIVSAATILPFGATSALAPPPSQWPNTPQISVGIEGWPNAVRFSGADRYQTSLATTLALRGRGDFPFDTPDRSSAGAATLAAANDWWGIGVCPRAIIVVAGDNPADSLAASSLSDPTGLSSEPYLQRSAAADPLFDPVGGFTRVDTDFAPLLVTTSARAGATQLSTPTRLAAQDLRSGGCTLARQAIIVGGPASVPVGVDAELVSLGYDEVFRVSGASRYATAAAVAQSLGTFPIPAPGATTCTDPTVDDGLARMTFSVNSVVELRDSGSSCRRLGRTVVLADGVTGADALAAGWWTSFWQVPVLLHDGGTVLPAATAAALTTLDVDHLIVLGGTSRISDDVAAAASGLTGAQVIRIAGEDRYDTSVQMAKRLGGWWPTNRADEFQSSMVCIAASSGGGATAKGWPDALGAGPLCAAANGAAANPGAPTRAIAPVDGRQPTLTPTGAVRGAHDAVPILLVPAGSATLPDSVAALLRESFAQADNWCSSVAATAGCKMPGFAIAFGGPTIVASAAIDQISSIVSGGITGSDPQPAATLGGAFFTSLDMSAVFATTGTGTSRVCANRGAYGNARWLALYGDAASAQFIDAADVMMSGRYNADADTVVRSRGVGSPACVSIDASSRSSISARGVTLAGNASGAATFAVAVANRFTLDRPVQTLTPTSSSGTTSDLDSSGGGSTTFTFVTTAPAGPVAVVSRSAASTVSTAAVTITIARGVNTATSTGPDLFTATWSLTTPLGTISGSASGEAVLSAGVWRLRGSATSMSGWNVTSGAGGFTADLQTNSAGVATDDTAAWRVDGLVAG
jgi:ell wall binding domain 2 (CWB2)